MNKLLIFVIGIFSFFCFATIAQASMFEGALQWMYDRGFTKYNTLEGFRANDPITRWEAAKFATNYGDVIQLAWSYSTCDFDDIWGYDETLFAHIAEACKLWLLKWSNRKFYPNNNITEAEALTMLMRSIHGIQDETTAPWYLNYYDLAQKYGMLAEGETLESIGYTSITRGKLWVWMYALGYKIENGIISIDSLNNNWENPPNNDTSDTISEITDTSYAWEVDDEYIQWFFEGSEEKWKIFSHNPTTAIQPIKYNDSNDNYYIEDWKVYALRNWKGFIVKGADAETFREAGYYAKIDWYYEEYVTINYWYAIDKNNVYYFGIEIENADPISFVAKYLGYAHDKNAVYYLGILMPCADPSTLTVTQYVVKDKNYMYLNWNPIYTDRQSEQAPLSCFMTLSEED